MVTRLQAGQSWVLILAEARDLWSPKISRWAFGADRACCSV